MYKDTPDDLCEVCDKPRSEDASICLRSCGCVLCDECTKPLDMQQGTIGWD